MAYKKFAHFYDAFMEGAPYDEWVNFTKDMISQYRPNSRGMIDLGCGTGEIAIRLAELNFAVTGVDLSSEMLAIAHQKAQEKNLDITWIEQDLRRLQNPYEYDVAISYCDVINYVTDPEEIREIFLGVYKLLSENGLFLFDVHSEKYVNDFLASNTFAEVRNEVSYIWFCEPGEEESSVEHELTFFVQNDNGSYNRYDETHLQRTFPISFYQKLLQDCGFTILNMYGDFSEEITERTDRIFIVCQK
ncbi:ubiquinone/menaquinone biosynthesis C-methylase UbiE [Salirhabdus euzebyi]|uniref:Ubiquinone/menaquinone biosynthesis C-methylase UbiE n=1 Tax=Salirhabdus euzebyi TaxID=394506 RepID=A0A841Q7N2_9BACI|nr:class I SAM-dependent methyltransferase [Salirhabdus euzebyi]MBB6454343.1 ubiquinone/menaquinone biosynthesis C-methylase UbiE [Salirhabdus euzebyi]